MALGHTSCPLYIVFRLAKRPVVETLRHRLRHTQHAVSAPSRLLANPSGTMGRLLTVSRTSAGRSSSLGSAIPRSLRIVLQTVSMNSFAVPIARSGSVEIAASSLVICWETYSPSSSCLASVTAALVGPEVPVCDLENSVSILFARPHDGVNHLRQYLKEDLIGAVADVQPWVRPQPVVRPVASACAIKRAPLVRQGGTGRLAEPVVFLSWFVRWVRL
jgi:hypothetical protein